MPAAANGCPKSAQHVPANNQSANDMTSWALLYLKRKLVNCGKKTEIELNIRTCKKVETTS